MVASRRTLESRVQNLNLILDRPMTRMDEFNGWNIGHLTLNIRVTAPRRLYQLVEIVNDSGGEQIYSDSLHLNEMNHYLDGIVKGMAFRNYHIGQQMLQYELTKNNISSPPAMYSTELVEAVRAVTKKGTE